MKKLLPWSIVAIVSLALSTACLELYLRWQGYGDPPLYRYDPAAGYVLEPSQHVKRVYGCQVRINSMGMRSPEVSFSKPRSVFRVMVMGDSVPFGGSYIDQEDTFCYVAERLLNVDGKRFQILNAGVNAYGPQNVSRCLESKGTFDSDIIVVLFPWGNLRRDFANFYIVPFWHNSPDWAMCEFFRHAIWIAFGRLSAKWKEIHVFDNELSLTQNLEALSAIQAQCLHKGTPVFFFWSPYKDVLLGRSPDVFASDVIKLRKHLPEDLLIDLAPEFRKQADISSLFFDGVHYSKRGHQLVGRVISDFVMTKANGSVYQSIPLGSHKN